jgi:hypothetical protein
MPDELAQAFARYADTFSPLPAGDFGEVLQRNVNRRRRVVLSAVAVGVVVLLAGTGLVFASSNRAEQKSTTDVRIDGQPLTGRTWYLQSVTRLGRTWTPQAVSTLTFTDGNHAWTFDSASRTNWKFHRSGSAISGGAVDGEQESGAGGPVSFQVGVALQALITQKAGLVLHAGTLTIAGTKGQLRYGTSAPLLAPTGAVDATAQEKALGASSRLVKATLTVTDADGLKLLGYKYVPTQPFPLTDLATGSYTLAGAVRDGTCTSVTFTVRSGKTTKVTVECSVPG